MRPGFDPWLGKIPWRRAWKPTPVFLLGQFHEQRRLAGYSPWGLTQVNLDFGSHVWLMPAVLDRIGVRSQSWNAALALFDFKSLFSPLPHGALGRGRIFEWSRRLNDARFLDKVSG